MAPRTTLSEAVIPSRRELILSGARGMVDRRELRAIRGMRREPGGRTTCNSGDRVSRLERGTIRLERRTTCTGDFHIESRAP